MNIDFRLQRAMHRTLAGDLHKFVALGLRYFAIEFDLHVNPVEHSLLRFAVGAVLRVNPAMPERNSDMLERPLLSSGV